MQVNTQNIKRPSLWLNFFTEELDHKNDFVSYINTSSNNSNIVHKSNVTSNFRKNAKSLIDNIKKSLKSKNIRFAIHKDTSLDTEAIISLIQTKQNEVKEARLNNRHHEIPYINLTIQNLRKKLDYAWSLVDVDIKPH